MRYRLTMRSGVAADNDAEIGDFNRERVAYEVGELLWAMDRMNHPEYRGFDVVEVAPDAMPTGKCSNAAAELVAVAQK